MEVQQNNQSFSSKQRKGLFCLTFFKWWFIRWVFSQYFVLMVKDVWCDLCCVCFRREEYFPQYFAGLELLNRYVFVINTLTYMTRIIIIIFLFIIIIFIFSFLQTAIHNSSFLLSSRYEETWVTLHKRTKECAKAAEVSRSMADITPNTDTSVTHLLLLPIYQNRLKNQFCRAAADLWKWKAT